MAEKLAIKAAARWLLNCDTKRYGSGLGLYIVKSIVEASDGSIRLESPYFVETPKGKEERQGTAFFVTLPLSGMKKQEGTRGLQ